VLLVLLMGACSVYEPTLLEESGSEVGMGGESSSGSGGNGSEGAASGGKAGAAASSGSGAGGADTAGTAGTGGSQSVITDPYVTGDVEASPFTVVLSSEGKSDWVHWGLKGPTDSNRKAGVASQLLELAPFGSAMAVAYTGGPVAFSWNDGMPTAAATTHAGIAFEGVGEGFELSIPAVAEQRQARLYVGVRGGTAKLSAALSRGDVAPFEETFSSEDEAWVLRVATLEYGRVAASDVKLVLSLHVETGVLPEAAVSLSALSIDVK
jgi:hypothetical protein